MKKFVGMVCMVMCLAAAAWAQNQPAIAVASEGKPYFVTVDQVVLNINSIAGAAYVPTSGGGAIISVTYLNGVTSTFPVKISAEDWKKIQAQFVGASGRQ
ncbi:MAG TPA: hypothetical protein VGN88_04545 [Phycisphaerae bacterium]